ncbi:MAG: hypothetical protein A3E84_02265 [Gammaproteobacteria bacterium RIFCSPHIGHO2_12_FULL_42_13]|nr:MAG: hypothetical protein A3E84_02265 [Gammaproteobacteria bacterium RIFCSPHIGHO2_12_FULL_42_13]
MNVFGRILSEIIAPACMPPVQAVLERDLTIIKKHTALWTPDQYQAAIRDIEEQISNGTRLCAQFNEIHSRILRFVQEIEDLRQYLDEGRAALEEAQRVPNLDAKKRAQAITEIQQELLGAETELEAKVSAFDEQEAALETVVNTCFSKYPLRAGVKQPSLLEIVQGKFDMDEKIKNAIGNLATKKSHYLEDLQHRRTGSLPQIPFEILGSTLVYFHAICNEARQGKHADKFPIKEQEGALDIYQALFIPCILYAIKIHTEGVVSLRTLFPHYAIETLKENEVAFIRSTLDSSSPKREADTILSLLDQYCSAAEVCEVERGLSNELSPHPITDDTSQEEQHQLVQELRKLWQTKQLGEILKRTDRGQRLFEERKSDNYSNSEPPAAAPDLADRHKRS